MLSHNFLISIVYNKKLFVLIINNNVLPCPNFKSAIWGKLIIINHKCNNLYIVSQSSTIIITEYSK